MTSVATIAGRLMWWNDNPPSNGYDQLAYSAGADGQMYRNDCSGYVSMLTSITGSPNTLMLRQGYTTPISKDQLQFGCILLATSPPDSSGHVVMFDSWTDSSQTAYNGHEFGWGAAPLHRVVPYPYDAYDSRTFLPYQLDIVDYTVASIPVASNPITVTPSVPAPPPVVIPPHATPDQMNSILTALTRTRGNTQAELRAEIGATRSLLVQEVRNAGNHKLGGIKRIVHKTKS